MGLLHLTPPNSCHSFSVQRDHRDQGMAILPKCVWKHMSHPCNLQPRLNDGTVNGTVWNCFRKLYLLSAVDPEAISSLGAEFNTPSLEKEVKLDHFGCEDHPADVIDALSKGACLTSLVCWVRFLDPSGSQSHHGVSILKLSLWFWMSWGYQHFRKSTFLDRT